MPLIPMYKKKKPPIIPTTNTSLSKSPVGQAPSLQATSQLAQGQQKMAMGPPAGMASPGVGSVGGNIGGLAGSFAKKDWLVGGWGGRYRPPPGQGNRTGHESGNFDEDLNDRDSPGSPGGEAQPQKTQEQLYDQALRDLLASGPRDTAADEQQIQEMLQHTVGAGQADLNARLGAGGFGTSGALGALSGDMRAMAARQAAEEIMGVRRGARDEYMDRIGMGLDASATDRGLDIREDAYGRYLDALEASLGVTPGAKSNNPFLDETLDPGGDFWKTDQQAREEHERALERDDDGRPATEWVTVDEPAEGAVRLSISDNDPTYDYYSDGTRVRK